MMLRALVTIVAFVSLVVACDQNDCGDLDTLQFASPTQSCFGVSYTCSLPGAVVSSTACGSGYSDFALNINANATCTFQVTCADGTTQTIAAEWIVNSAGCAPVLVSGPPFDHTVCAGDGGVPFDATTPPDASDASQED